MIDQESLVKFSDKCKKISVICSTETALGDLHDFLLLLKGTIVDRMIKAQKEEEHLAESQKKEESENGSIQ